MEEPKKPEIKTGNLAVRARHDYFDFPPDYEPPEHDFGNDRHWSPDETVLYLAARGSGKSTNCMAYLLYYRYAYANAFVFSNTTSNNFWQQFVPEPKVAEGLDEMMLRDLLELSAENLQKWRRLYKHYSRCIGSPYNVVILEDLIDSQVLRKSEALRSLFFNGRHSGLAAHILSQDYAGLTPGQRDNVDRS